MENREKEIRKAEKARAKQRKQAEKLIKQDTKAKAKVEKKVTKEIAKACASKDHEIFEDDIKIINKYVDKYTAKKERKQRRVAEQSHYLIYKETLSYLNNELNKVEKHKKSIDDGFNATMDFLGK